jgi:hypothetical protein
MAKAATKSSTKEPKKASAASKTKASEASQADKIEKACEDAVQLLKKLDIDQQLQRDIEWCLGSYRSDKNPVGLYDMAVRALVVLQDAKAKKVKGITSKSVTDLEKAIQGREN